MEVSVEVVSDGILVTYLVIFSGARKSVSSTVA